MDMGGRSKERRMNIRDDKLLSVSLSLSRLQSLVSLLLSSPPRQLFCSAVLRRSGSFVSYCGIAWRWLVTAYTVVIVHGLLIYACISAVSIQYSLLP